MSGESYRASRVQERFLDAPRPIVVHTCWEVGVEVDPSVMARAVTWLAARQAMLRTTFAREDGAWVARVGEPAVDHVEVVDARGWSGETLQAHLEAATLTAFDRAARAPFVVRLYQLSGGRTVFFPLLDHVLLDGWSLQTLVTELWVVYAALAVGAEPDLPPLDRTYADYAAAEAALVESAAGARQLAFWERRLAEVPPLDPPTDHPRVEPRRWRGGSVPFRLAPEAWQAVRATAPLFGTTPFVVLFAAYFSVISQWSGRRAFAVGTSSAGRWSERLRHVIGPYVNPVAVSASVDPVQPARAQVREVQARLIEALANRDLPFGAIVERIAPPSSARPPLFETMFIMLNVFDLDQFRSNLASLLGLPEAGVSLLHPVPNRYCRYDFEVLVYEYGGALHGALDYDRDLYDHATMARLASDYTSMLTQFSSLPEAPLAATRESA